MCFGFFFVWQANQNGSTAEPTCIDGNKRWGEEADIAVGESRVSQAGDEGQGHWRWLQGLHSVHVGVSRDGC